MKKYMKYVIVTLSVLAGLQALALGCTSARADDLQIAEVKAKYAAMFSLGGSATKRMMLENECISELSAIEDKETDELLKLPREEFLARENQGKGLDAVVARFKAAVTSCSPKM